MKVLGWLLLISCLLLGFLLENSVVFADDEAVTTVTVSSSAERILPGDVVTITVTIESAESERVPSQPISLMAVRGVITPDNPISDSTGEATVEFTAGSVPGRASVTALAYNRNGIVDFEIVDPSKLNVLTAIVTEIGDGTYQLALRGSRFQSGTEIFVNDVPCNSLVIVDTNHLRCNSTQADESMIIKVVNPDGETAILQFGSAVPTQILHQTVQATSDHAWLGALTPLIVIGIVCLAASVITIIIVHRGRT